MTIGKADSLALPGDRPTTTAAARARVVIALLVGCCIGVVGLAILGQAPQVPALEFTQSGHWVYSSGLQAALHVDGATGQVDAQASVPGAAEGSQVVQGDTSGFVVGRSRVTEFSKSTLSVTSGANTPAPETPVALEVVGGPYLVYRNAGQVVRLGDPLATVPAGGPVADPVATSDGTVWVLREDNGALCELPRGTTELTCPARLPQGHTGELTLVADQPAVLDLTGGDLRPVGADGLGTATPLGVKLSAAARVADNAVDGRLAVLDPGARKLVLIDTAGRDTPVAVTLPGNGTFTGPVAVAHTVAVVDQTSHQVLTYDSQGKHTGTTPVPGASGSPRLTTGQDARIYVDSPDGSHVLVVNGQNGSVVDVNVDGQAPGTPSGGRPAGHAQTTLPPSTSTVDSPPPVANATPPGAPGDIVAVAGDGSARVSWSPAKPNGAPVTGYRISWSGGSMAVGGSTLHATVTGLTNGTPYVLTVVAENSTGRGAGASSASVVPGRAADAPGVSATVSGSQLNVSWTTPNLHGAGLVHYLVTATGQGERVVSGTSTSYTGLTGTVTVTVRAVTQYGSSGGLLTGGTGSRQVSMPAATAAPTVKITDVRSWDGALYVTVNANGMGGAATCQATFLGVSSPWTSCSGSTRLTISNVSWFGSVTVDVVIKNPVGTGSDSWTGTPPTEAPSAVFWFSPTLLAGLRRPKKKKKDKS